MRDGKWRVLFVAIAGLMWGCGSGGSSTPAAPTPSTPTVTSVTVTGPSGSAKAGDSAQFTATAALSSGSSQTVTNQATSQSSNGGVATIPSTGLATAVSAGDADIRATYQGVTGTAHITVTAPPPPPPPPPPPTTFSACGTVKEDSGSATVAGASVVVKDSSASTTSDSSGRYCVSLNAAGRITLRTTKAGYDLAEQDVNVTGNVTADIAMHKQTAPPAPPPPTNGICAASSIPASAVCIGTGVPPVTAVCDDGAFSCSRNRSGTCSGHGGVKCWVCPGLLCNGLTIDSEQSFSPAYGGFSPVVSSSRQ